MDQPHFCYVIYPLLINCYNFGYILTIFICIAHATVQHMDQAEERKRVDFSAFWICSCGAFQQTGSLLYAHH